MAGSPKKRAKRESATKAAKLKASGDVKIREPEILPPLSKANGKFAPVYTEKLGARIAEDLAHGITLRELCKQPGMPAPSTVIKWAIDEHHPFYGRYEQARLIGYTIMADDIINIADDTSGDFVERTGQNGETSLVPDSENVARSRLRVEARKWVLAKALPKIFGDKVEHTGKDGAPLFPELVITYGTMIVGEGQ